MQLNDLSAHINAHITAINEATSRVIGSGWYILGPEVKKFEISFAEYIGVARCVGLANGTDAIELALRALGVNVGDHVATAANAGMYTTTAVRSIGAEPFFMDVDTLTRNVTLSEVQRAISSGVKAVVVTHLYGLATPEIEQIADLCVRNRVPLLEDCAQAHGAKIKGQRVGAFGNAASFSFYPTKNLGALGDGGAVVTNNTVIAERVSQLRQYGWATKYQVEVSGACNSRLDEMQAAILSALLPHLEDWNARRREIATRYSTHISNPKILAPTIAHEDYVAHLYVIRTSERDALREHLRHYGISSEIHYPIPDYRQPVFADRFVDMVLPNTEALAKEILTLPCYPEMTDDEVQAVIDAVNIFKPTKL